MHLSANLVIGLVIGIGVLAILFLGHAYYIRPYRLGSTVPLIGTYSATNGKGFVMRANFSVDGETPILEVEMEVGLEKKIRYLGPYTIYARNPKTGAVIGVFAPIERPDERSDERLNEEPDPIIISYEFYPGGIAFGLNGIRVGLVGTGLTDTIYAKLIGRPSPYFRGFPRMEMENLEPRV